MAPQTRIALFAMCKQMLLAMFDVAEDRSWDAKLSGLKLVVVVVKIKV